MEYNEFGHIVKYNSYNKKWNINYNKVYSYVYDDKGKIIECKVYKDDCLESEKFCTYYLNGVLREEKEEANRDFEISKSIKKYDRDGNRTYYEYERKNRNSEYEKEKVDYHNGGKKQQKVVEKYDSNKKLIERCIFKYDENECKISVEEYNLITDVTLTYIYKYEFDKKGNWTKRLKYLENIPCEITERTFEYFE